MRSPVANQKPMQRETLEDGLIVFRCVETGGILITADSYWRWLHKQPERLAHLPALAEEGYQKAEPGVVKICPETVTLMSRFKAGHGFDFTIDRSITGNIWLDAGEWEAPRARQFHDEIHLVFTAPWRNDVQEMEASENTSKRLEECLRSELIERLNSLKKELEVHPHRMMALALLNER
ncbi:hypothetical protein N9898_00670 [Akkermansiaceae bacterium]|nr:hypothetical protein [Akkermansiaceae bacterium]